jgi:histidinol-phosphate aminotransferase
MTVISQLVRDNILRLKPYSSARSVYRGEASALLDANENPLNPPYNRYPDPLQETLKQKIARMKHVRPSQIVLGGAGSDELIDLTIRIFCEPGIDNMVTIDPTYGMYQVCADINRVACRKALLNEDFTLDARRVLSATGDRTKLLFLCSPNNPSGNLLNRDEIRTILDRFNGITFLDEAYVDFSPEPSWLGELDHYPKMIVLQTFSKAWGLAAVRCGMAFADEAITALFNKVKYPYNVNALTQQFVYEQLDQETRKNQWVAMLLEQRTKLAEQLAGLPFVKKIYRSDANFLLVKMTGAGAIYGQLIRRGVIVRNRDTISLCNECLRITIGTATENETLINELKQL